MKQTVKKQTPTFVSNPFLSSSTSANGTSLTPHDINLLFLLLEEPQLQFKKEEERIQLASSIHTTMTEVNEQKILIPRATSCHQPLANFDRYQQDPKKTTTSKKDPATTSLTRAGDDAGHLPRADENMCYEEHKSNDPQNYSKRQRSPSPHSHNATEIGDIVQDEVNCGGGDEARRNKRQRLPEEETDSSNCARTEDKSSNGDDIPPESTNSSSTNLGIVSTSVSSSRINDSDAKPTTFNNASPCVESHLQEDDIKTLDSVFPSVPAMHHVLSSSKAEGQEGDITPLEQTETATDSGQGETDLPPPHHAPMMVDSWQAFMDKQQDTEEKGHDNEHQNMPAPQGEPLVPPSSSYSSWQEPNKNKAYSYPQPFEQHDNKNSTSSYHQARYDPHSHRHYNTNSAPYFHDSTHTTPHHSYGGVKQQEIAPSVVTRSDEISSSNYQRTTSGGSLRNNTSSYSHPQYRQGDGTTRSNYPDNPHHTGTYFAHHPAPRPRSRSSSRDHGNSTAVHSYPPVPPLNEAHYLNDSGELRYESYYPPNAITGGANPVVVNTKTQGDMMGMMARGQQRNQHPTNQNRENHDGDISSAYAHPAAHQYDHQQYYGRSNAQKARTTSGSSSSLSSSFNNSQQQQSSSEALQPYYNRPVLSLSTNDDENWLSEFLCFVRSQCVEVFSASQDDVASRMNSKKVLLGQVGIRCRFCAHLPHRERTGRSSSFPSSINRIYQSLTMMLRDHFTKCNAMPPQMNERYLCLKANASQGATDSKKYWIESARTLGLVDTEQEGMRFQHPRGHDNNSSAPGAPPLTGGGDRSSSSV
jgi:hypothetical protein